MVVDEDADVELYVNNFVEKQGEIVMKLPTEPFAQQWRKPRKPYVVADVRFANGSDNAFVEALFESGVDNLLGYSAWNTSANTLGSLFLGLKITLNSTKKGTFNQEAFNRLMLTRFLDDWAYQANVRQNLVRNGLDEKMFPFEKLLREKFPCSAQIGYNLPWNRLFEVEVVFS